ncbi:RidA family protein [Sphingobium chungbukense]|uniref:Endoribonuclease n=1 Tax=Sphingobium chungbukense TaxID=56193 RepID=A0A0M3AN65_9SPHN|nr:RidA family protein [Sphingobium chungbukense]KKW90376.1 endoribonuclease [Sphingobium chungbukense]
MDIRRLKPGRRMSQAVIHNGVVYLAGQIGAPGEDVATQTQAVLAQIDELLAEAGTDRSRLLQATIWLADIADYDTMNRIWEAWIGEAPTPARATAQACLARADWKIEVIVTAALR